MDVASKVAGFSQQSGKFLEMLSVFLVEAVQLGTVDVDDCHDLRGLCKSTISRQNEKDLRCT